MQIIENEEQINSLKKRIENLEMFRDYFIYKDFIFFIYADFHHKNYYISLNNPNYDIDYCTCCKNEFELSAMFGGLFGFVCNIYEKKSVKNNTNKINIL